jgi:hypothetical protein
MTPHNTKRFVFSKVISKLTVPAIFFLTINFRLSIGRNTYRIFKELYWKVISSYLSIIQKRRGIHAQFTTAVGYFKSFLWSGYEIIISAILKEQLKIYECRLDSLVTQALLNKTTWNICYCHVPVPWYCNQKLRVLTFTRCKNLQNSLWKPFAQIPNSTRRKKKCQHFLFIKRRRGGKRNANTFFKNRRLPTWISKLRCNFYAGYFFNSWSEVVNSHKYVKN